MKILVPYWPHWPKFDRGYPFQHKKSVFIFKHLTFDIWAQSWQPNPNKSFHLIRKGKNELLMRSHWGFVLVIVFGEKHLKERVNMERGGDSFMNHHSKEVSVYIFSLWLEVFSRLSAVLLTCTDLTILLPFSPSLKVHSHHVRHRGCVSILLTSHLHTVRT